MRPAIWGLSKILGQIGEPGPEGHPPHIYLRPGVYTAVVTALNQVSPVTTTVVATVTTGRSAIRP